MKDKFDWTDVPILIEVSEPWDFLTEVGTDKLFGLVETAKDKYLLIRLEKPINRKGRHCNRVIASARYIGEHIRDLSRLDTLTVSMTAIPSDVSSDFSALLSESSWKTGLGLVGILQKR